MAKSKIESDHGLNVRMFMTGLALVILYVIIFTVLLNVGVALVFVIVICAGLLFSQYFFSDKIAMFSMHAKEVTPAKSPSSTRSWTGSACSPTWKSPSRCR